MELALFVSGLLIIIIGIALIVMAIKEEFESKGFMENLGIVVLGIMLIILGVMNWIGLEKISNNKRETSKYEIKKEVRSEIVNGKEISRDTVYIFTPKEK